MPAGNGNWIVSGFGTSYCEICDSGRQPAKPATSRKPDIQRRAEPGTVRDLQRDGDPQQSVDCTGSHRRGKRAGESSAAVKPETLQGWNQAVIISL